MPNELGNFLKSTREEKNLTLRAVEKKTTISNAYLSQLEAGKIKQPSPNVLNNLSKFYKISYSYLMELSGYPVPSKSSLSSDTLKFAARLGPISENEEEELTDYLRFLRSKSKREK